VADRDEQVWIGGILINRKFIVRLFERCARMKAAGEKRMDVGKRNNEEAE